MIWNGCFLLGASWVFIQEISLQSRLWHKKRFTDKNEQSLGGYLEQWLKQKSCQFILCDKVSANGANCVLMSIGFRVCMTKGVGSVFFGTFYFLSHNPCWGYHLTFSCYNLESEALSPFDKNCRFFIFYVSTWYLFLRPAANSTLKPPAFHNHMYTSFEALFPKVMLKNLERDLRDAEVIFSVWM